MMMPSDSWCVFLMSSWNEKCLFNNLRSSPWLKGAPVKLYDSQNLISTTFRMGQALLITKNKLYFTAFVGKNKIKSPSVSLQELCDLDFLLNRWLHLLLKSLFADAGWTQLHGGWTQSRTEASLIWQGISYEVVLWPPGLHKRGLT